MGGSSVRDPARRIRRTRRWRRNARGVVSVVGTLLALLVFFALFGIFLTQYVPLWMTDNEIQFTSETQASVATLKSNVEQQLAFGAPSVYATPFTMSSEGIPLVAQPTQGVLQFLPKLPGIFAYIDIDAGAGGTSPYVQNLTNLGSLEMTLPNRYYTLQTFSFEDDAVIESQGGSNQYVAFPPVLDVRSIPGNTSVTMLLLNLYGNSTTIVSSGTQDVYSTYEFSQSISSSGRPIPGGYLPFNVTFKLGTYFPCAWSTFLNTTLGSGGVTGFTLLPANACSLPTDVPGMVTLVLHLINHFTLILGGVQIAIGVGTT